MNAATTLSRTPLLISAGNLTAGPVHAAFREGDRESLLHNYLVLVRRMRGQLREPTITLRNADISALAEHLGASEEMVLDDLFDRMGATRAQRKALLAMFAVGALSIVATGSVALELSTGGTVAEGSPDTPPAVVEAARISVVPEPAATDVVRTAAVETSSAAGETEVAAGETEVAAAETEVAAVTTVSVAQPELAIALGGDDWEYTLSLHQLAHALSTQPPETAASSAGVGVADDGSTVAVARPPVPAQPAEGVGVADDGSTVAVGTPPVPPTVGLGVAVDGSAAGVAPPPVP